MNSLKTIVAAALCVGILAPAALADEKQSPEATLKLFAEAIKKEDIEAANKLYCVTPKQAAESVKSNVTMYVASHRMAEAAIKKFGPDPVLARP